ncbi:hypothetical protein AVEN_18899-1 [Araneus ventricosus]|uniref:Uncharacterized protein n=1 Tax=Araneus ventricosus TaxID=182803 RepID=A0A4Y2JIG7_ARAVE|nr:hypothetical protein AVEN_18899-1 [Araneus ventricosus]
MLNANTPNVSKMEKHIKKCFKCPRWFEKVFEKDAIDNEFCFRQIPTMTSTSNLEFLKHLSFDVDDPDEPDLAREMPNTSSNNTAVSATRSSLSLSLLKTVRTANISADFQA